MFSEPGSEMNFSCVLLGIGVYLLERSSREQSPWAIKKWMQKRSNKKNFKRLQFEAQILQKLNHPNIVGFRGFIKGMDGKPCLAMEALSTSLGIWKAE